MAEAWTFEDAFTGQTMTGEWDPATSPPEEFFSPIGRAAENAGTEASVPGWFEARYFGSRPEYEHFKAEVMDITDWFASDIWQATTNGKWWAGLADEDRERKIYEAGQRIQKTYKGGPSGHDGNVLEYPTAEGVARCIAEGRLGVAVGSLY